MKYLLLILLFFSCVTVSMELSFRRSIIKGSDLQVKDVLNGAEFIANQPWPEELQNWVTQENITQWLKDSSGTEQRIRWQGPKKAWIKLCYKPDVGALNPALQALLQREFALIPESIAITFHSKHTPCIDSPVKRFSIVSIQPGNSNQLTVRTQLSGQSGATTQFPLLATIDASINALRLSKNVAADTPLVKAAFEGTTRKWTGKEFSADSNLSEFQFKKAIKAGEIIASRDLEQRFSVNAGDLVTVLLRKGAINIETEGKAMDNADIGETIRIKVASGDKLSAAKVVAQGVVLVKA